MKQTLICTFLLLSLTLYSASCGSWTIMVWMCADNNLESYGLVDMNEMEAGMTDDLGVRVIVQIDRSEGYSSADGNWTDSRIYRIKSDSDTSVLNSEVVERPGEINMGDGEKLSEFMAYCAVNFPAMNYMLILWDHGAGWISIHDAEEDCSRQELTKSICHDAKSNDELTIAEIYRSVQSFKTLTGKKLAILGFDACLMQMLEVAYQFQNYADHIVGSEELEPGDGWPYQEIVSYPCREIGLNPKLLAKAIPRYYHQSYSSKRSGTTLSSIDTSTMGETAGMVSRLAFSLYNFYDATAFSSVISSTNSFLNDSSGGKIKNKYLDIYDFCEKLKADATYSMAYPEVIDIASSLKSQINSGQFSGEVSDSTSQTTYTSHHPVNLYIYHNPAKTNQVVPQQISQILPQNITAYNWISGSAKFSYELISTDTNFSSCFGGITPVYNGSYTFKTSDGNGYAFKLYPTYRHTACPATSEYLKIAGVLKASCTGNAKIRHLITANYSSHSGQAGGVSIWLPQLLSGQTLPSAWEMQQYRMLRFSKDTFWDEFILKTVGSDMRKSYLDYSMIDFKARNYLEAETSSEKALMMSQLKMELTLSLESGMPENVDRFLSNYSDDSRMKIICDALAYETGNLELIREKTGNMEE